MSSNTFSLVDLIPEPLIFRDIAECKNCGGEGRNGDTLCVACAGRGKVSGAKYEAKTTPMFGATELARYERVQKESRQAFAVLQSKEGDKETAAAEVEALTDDLLRIIVPDLPRENLEKLPFGYKFKFLEWWQERQPKQETAEGKPTPGRSATRAQRSRGSSSRATTPKRS